MALTELRSKRRIFVKSPGLNRAVEEQHRQKARRVTPSSSLLDYVFLVQHNHHNHRTFFACVAYTNQ